MFDEYMICGNFLTQKKTFNKMQSLQIRLPWYRSLPFSCIEELEVNVDGIRSKANDVYLYICGQLHSMNEVSKLHDVFWFVLDTVDVCFCMPQSLGAGAHDVSIRLTMRIPYVDHDFNDIDFYQVASCGKKLEIVGEE